MMKFSDFRMEPFEGERKTRVMILLNRVETHENKRYMLILGQDLQTNHVVKLVDTHGLRYDLYEWNSDWEKIKAGMIIEVACVYHNSPICVNVLRVKSNYTELRTVHYVEEIKKSWSDFINENIPSLSDFLMLSNIGASRLFGLCEELKGKRAFILFPMRACKLVKYTANNKVKYQLRIGDVFADIMCGTQELSKRENLYYTGYSLLEISQKPKRPCMKVYDLLNEDNCFTTTGAPFGFVGGFDKPADWDDEVNDSDLPL